MKRHVNIPIFIPHLGCPNQCVFCNQRTISGVDRFDISDIRRQIDDALATVGSECEAEIAFFGGSFTGIDRNLMISLLKLAHEYVTEGCVTSIRCSTRPDYINEDILDLLAHYGVKTVELGLQSASDKVLCLSKRGHTFADEEKACEMIVARGFDLVGQMMIGLPGSTAEDELQTARFIVKSGARGARIYPTVVFYGTELCEMADSGKYSPIALSEAVERTAKVLEIFVNAEINVIRIGLCSSENLLNSEKYHSGPNHPAIGEMVESQMIYNKLTGLLDEYSNLGGAILHIYIAKGYTSKVIGQKKTNKIKLIRKYGLADVIITEDERLCGYELKVEVERKRECT